MARGLKKISESKSQAKTKKPVTRRAKPKAVSSKELKPFVFVTGETKYVGNEPVWTEQPTRERTSQLARAFTWYSYFFQNKEAKPMLLQYLEHTGRKDEARQLKSLADSEFSLTACWLARMQLMGLELTETERTQFEKSLTLLKSKTVINTSLEISKEKKPGIQDHIRNKTLDIAGELEGVYDEWVRAGARSAPAITPIDTMKSMNLVPTQIAIIQDAWSRELAELKATLTDKTVAESYDRYTKTQIKAMIKYCEQVLSDCASYVQVKKVERKPRAKKMKTPEQLTRSFKYLKEFTDLKLKSEAPSKLVAATEAWLYDTRRRKLIHIVADSNAGSLTVKGSSIVGYSVSDTVMKTLRKPADQLKEIFSGGKPAIRKEFKDIKTTEAKWNGRSNTDIVILKVW